MSKSQYNITIKEFDTYKIACSATEKGEMLLANMSKLSTSLFCSQLDQFSKVEYSRREIERILDNKDVETFQGICPLYFRSMNMKMTAEQEAFFCENVTIEQLCYMPIPVFKVFKPESLTVMIDKIMSTNDEISLKHHSVYEIYVPLKEEKADYAFFVIKEADIIDVLRSQKTYVTENENSSRYERDFRDLFGQDSMTLSELADYLHIHPQYLKKVYFEDKTTSFNKYLKPYKKKQDSHNIVEFRVTTKSVLDLLKHTYTGKPTPDKDFIYEHGLLDWKSLASLKRLESTLTHATVFHNFRQGNLAAFRLSERIVRFSEDDFEEFYQNKPQRTFNERGLIQFPLNISEEDKATILTDYIEEKSLYDRLSCSVKSVEDIGNYRCLPMVRDIRSQLTLYSYRGSKYSYYRKEDVNEVVSKMYGYKKDGKFIGGKEFDLDLCRKLLRIEPLMGDLSRRYPEVKYSTIYTELTNKTNNGSIPYINAGKRRHMYIWEDVVKVLDEKFYKS